MIPKVIHYCWFGGKPLNALGNRCLASWYRYFPDYEIVQWNENNVDLTNCQYACEAYAEKKWAFVSDYVRFKILYEQGGIYFDTDVEIIKSFDDILQAGSFMGCENPDMTVGTLVAPGLGIAVEPGLPIIREILDEYEKSSFYNEDGSLNLFTVVQRTTDILKRHGLKNTMEIQKVAGLTIYPWEYFCPINMNNAKLELTENTHSIHRYASSWETPKNRFRGKIYRALNRYFGEKTANFVKKIFGKKADRT